VKIGGAAYDEYGKVHPTAAGLLMFGEEYNIVREFPEYFLDYREMLDPTIRWTDRVQSSSGDWTGNVMDFFFRVNSKIAKDIKVPFKLEGITRIDDTPVHKAVREALVNCMVNTDYFLPRGVVIRKESGVLTIENPGSVRTGKKQMLRGGISDPRNKTLMKMFNLIGIGERAGSGIPDIYQVWEDEGWAEPKFEEQYNPDRTILTLSFAKSDDKKATIKSDDKKAMIKSDNKKQTKTSRQQEQIRNDMISGKEYRLQDFCDLLGLKETRTKEILKPLIDGGKIVVTGKNKDRRYIIL
jgi:predicted HTH transcriptional regulator